MPPTSHWKVSQNLQNIKPHEDVPVLPQMMVTAESKSLQEVEHMKCRTRNFTTKDTL